MTSFLLMNISFLRFYLPKSQRILHVRRLNYTLEQNITQYIELQPHLQSQSGYAQTDLQLPYSYGNKPEGVA